VDALVTLKIAYVGNFLPAHSTENQYRRSFERLGHTVWPLQENDSPSWAEQTDGWPDLLVWTRTWGPDAYGRSQINDVRRHGVPTAAVHLDLWWGLTREQEILTRHKLGQTTMFDLDWVFTADGDHDARFAEVGINHRWLRPGVVEDECYDAEPDPEWAGRWDVAFVGSAPTERGGNYHDEWPHRRKLVEHLEHWYGDRFVHVGNGGHLGNNTDRPNLRGDDINRLYASVPVIVGDSCFSRIDGRYWSERVYETWGRGGFLIHPRIYALEAEIGDYPSWRVGDWDVLHRVIDWWLGDHPARNELRRKIAGTVRTKSTYTQRAAEMLAVIDTERTLGKAEIL
jgi:hypothetical protein